MLKITTSPTRITISDNNRNTLNVVKTSNGIEFTSTLNDNNVITPIFALQQKIKQHILHPVDSRDNYKVRFDKLGKAISKLNINTFLGLKHKIV